MSKRYGLPFKGSKNAIAQWVIDNLPQADTLVDLFAGGCAVTHCAMLSGKYKHVIANDINGEYPKMFQDALNGEFSKQEYLNPVSREKFFALKDADPFIRLVYSFGNDATSYLYGRDHERIKLKAQEMLVSPTLKERYRCYREFIKMLQEELPPPKKWRMVRKIAAF